MKMALKIQFADGRSFRWNFHQPEKLRAAKKDREFIVFTDEAVFIKGKPRVIGQQLFLSGKKDLCVMDLEKVIGWIYSPKNLSKDEPDDAP